MLQPLILALSLPFLMAPMKMAKVVPPADSDIQKDLNDLYATIDKGIQEARRQGKNVLNVTMEDPEFSEQGFSEGMKALVSVLIDHYSEQGYKVVLSTSGHNVIMRLSWDLRI